MLARVWFSGLGPDGEELPDETARRERIAQMRANTADNDAGARIRSLIDRFAEEHM